MHYNRWRSGRYLEEARGHRDAVSHYLYCNSLQLTATRVYAADIRTVTVMLQDNLSHYLTLRTHCDGHHNAHSGRI